MPVASALHPFNNKTKKGEYKSFSNFFKDHRQKIKRIASHHLPHWEKKDKKQLLESIKEKGKK